MNYEKTEDKTSEYVNSLDGIRGVAAVIIACMLHYQEYLSANTRPLVDISGGGGIAQIISNVHRFGYLGVEIFFVISGFVIYNSFYEKICSKRLGFSAFFIKRLIRLLPLHYLTMFLVFVVQQHIFYEQGAFYNWNSNDLFSIIVNFFCLQNSFGVSLNGPAWYLTVLLTCYIIFYICAYNFKDSFKWISLLISISGLVVVVLDLNVPFMKKYDGRGYLCFFLGVIVAIIVKNLKKKEVKRFPITVISILSIVLWCYSLNRTYLLGTLSSPFAIYYITFAIYVCIPVLLLANFSKVFIHIFGSSVLCFLGKISYSVYLWNFPTALILVHLNQHSAIVDFNTIGGWCIYVFTLLVIAIVSHYYIEPVIISGFKRLVKLFVNG